MENSRFEDSFRNAFDGAEVLPSNAVWTNIELDLEKTSGGKMKRTLLMFQLLAAASIAFAFGVTALYYLDQPVTQGSESRGALSKQGIAPIPETAKQSSDQKTSPEAFIKKNERSDNQKVNNFNNDTGNTIASQLVKEQPVNSWIEYKVERTDLLSYTKTRKPVLVLPKAEEPVEPDAGMVLLARLRDEERKYQDEEKKASGSTEKIWASVGFGAGSYKPNVQSSSVNLGTSFAGTSPSSSESVVGASYSVGVNVATKISKRFIVQGGVSYLTQNADFTSTTSNHGAASLNEFMKPANFDGFESENPYTITSSSQFVSIPVQAGYLIIDRDFGIQLNGGIATDLFIQNTLSPETNTYQKVTQAAGKDSPYRTVNFSGLLGTEFSYKIADQYRISLNPGLRYSLNSIYREDVAAEIIPVTFDVSLRFRYIFK
jgi:hypothetical protein